MRFPLTSHLILAILVQFVNTKIQPVKIDYISFKFIE